MYVRTNMSIYSSSIFLFITKRAQKTKKMLWLTKRSTCDTLGLTERCDPCTRLLELRLNGKKQRKGSKPSICTRPWKWEIKQTTKATTKMKKQRVLDEINDLGYNIEDNNIVIKSAIYNYNYSKERLKKKVVNVVQQAKKKEKDNSILPELEEYDAFSDSDDESLFISDSDSSFLTDDSSHNYENLGVEVTRCDTDVLESDSSMTSGSQKVDPTTEGSDFECDSCLEEQEQTLISFDSNNSPLLSQSSEKTSRNSSSSDGQVHTPTNPPVKSRQRNQRSVRTVNKNVKTQSKVVVVKNLPVTHAVVAKHQLTKMKEKAKKLDDICRNLEQKRYDASNEEANRMLATAAVMLPKASQDALQSAVPLIVGAACVNAHIPVDVSKVAMSAPSQKTIDRLVENLSVDTMIKFNAMIKKNPHVYLLCDKANSEKKGAKIASFPKLLVLVDPDSGEIVELLLDCDSAGSSSAEAAKAIAHSMRTKLAACMPVVLAGVTTDSGGGGTLHSLVECLVKEGVADNDTRVTSCSLHNVQTCLRNCVEEVFGAGGMSETKVGRSIKRTFKMNAMQLMNGVFNLFTYLDLEVLKGIWEHTNNILGTNEPFHKLTNPVLTRWWLVGQTACDLDKYWDHWKVIMGGLVNLPKSRGTEKKDNASALRDIAAANKNLFQFQEIKLDIKMIAALHTYWVFPHFKFLQLGDPVSGNKSGYQARLMTERYVLMHGDLVACMDNKWKQQAEFENIVSLMNTMSDEQKVKVERKMMHSISIMIDYLEKHFKNWCNQNLPFALFSSATTAQVVAKVILRKLSLSTPATSASPPPLPATRTTLLDILATAAVAVTPTTPTNMYKSNLQNGREINLNEYETFIAKRFTMTQENVHNHQDVRMFIPAIKEIAEGKDMWDEVNLPLNSSLHQYRLRYKERMVSNATTLQSIEREVKRGNHVNLDSGKRREDKKRSMYAMTNSDIVKNTQTKKKMKTDDTREVWVRDKAKSVALIDYTLNSSKQILDARNSLTQDQQNAVKEGLTQNEKQWSKARNDDMIKLYQENFGRTDLPPHQLEAQTDLDTTDLVAGRVPFKKMTKTGGFFKVLCEEADARNIVMTNDERKKVTVVKEKIKQHEGNDVSFKPCLPFERFAWYKA